MADGFTLIVPKEMIDRLDVADKKLAQLAKTSENTERVLIASFKNMTDGVGGFINMLNNANIQINSLSANSSKLQQLASVFQQLKSGDKGSPRSFIDASKIATAVDKINQLVTGLKNLKSLNKISLQIQQENVDYQKKANQIKETANAQAQLTRELERTNLARAKNERNELALETQKLANATKELLNIEIQRKQNLALDAGRSKNNYTEQSLEVKRQANELQQLLNIEAERKRQLALNDAQNKNKFAEESLAAKQYANELKNLAEVERLRRQQTANENATTRNALSSQSVEIKRQANDIKEAANAEEERGRQLILQNKRNIAAYKEEAAELKRITDEINRQAKAYREMPASMASKDAGKYVKQSIDATTINQRLTAIHNLKSAIKDLDSNDKRYQATLARLNAEIKRHEQELQRAGVQTQNLNKSHRKLMDTSGQLQRKFALMFSVSAITGYVNKLAEVRGEFEMQQKSLDVIIGNKQKSDEIWNKTVALAVRSPFKVGDLVKYTKQLAAYRIETDKLYETNKMLADVSAGLGVDMQRLILAYGQIKAAGFLRGTEVRQLTEAGVNVYEELAKHFSEMEKTDVTVAQVIDRISKRQVAFSDVEQVFKNITSEDGVFYKMQERQSETLLGMMRNLSDSVDLMLNDIGKSSEGALKGSVSLLKDLVDNWRILATVLKLVAGTIVIMDIAKFATGWNMVAKEGAAAALAMNGVAGAGARANVALKAIWNTLKANPFYAVISVVAAAGVAFYDYVSAVNEANAVYDEHARVLARQVLQLEEVKSKVAENNAVIKQHEDLKNKENVTTEDLAASQGKANAALSSNSKILAELKNKYPDVYKGIQKQKDGTIELNNAIEEQNDKLRANILLQKRAKGNLISDDLITNAKDAQEKLVEYQNAIDDVNIAAEEGKVALEEMYASGEISKDKYDAISKYLQELSKVKDAQEARTKSGGLKFELGGLNANFFDDIVDKVYEAESAFISYKGSLDDLRSNLEKQAPIWRNTITKMLQADPEKGADNAREFINSQLTEFEIYDEQIKKWAFEEIVKFVGVKLSFDIPGGQSEDPVAALSGWRREIWDLCTALQAVTPDVTIPIKPEDLLTASKPYVVNLVTKWVDEIISTAEKQAEASAQPGQGVYTEADKKQQQATLKAAADLKRYLGSPFKSKSSKSTSRRDKSGSTESGQEKKEDPVEDFASVIEDIYERYEDGIEYLSKKDAGQAAINAYTDTFNESLKKITASTKGYGLSLTNLIESFKTKGVDGLIEELERLQKIAKDNKVKQSLGETISELRFDKQIDSAEALADARDREIDQLFELYDVYKELKEIGIDDKSASTLFGINAKSLKDIRNELEMRKTEFVGTEGEAKYQEYLDRIAEMDNKEQQERLNTYLEYANKAVSERAKIKLDELRKMNEIEETFAVKDGDSKDVVAAKESLRAAAIKKSQKEYADALKKLEWEEFQKSDMFLMLFEDLDGASEQLMQHTLDQLKNFKEQWADMPLEDVKAITDKINDLESALINLKNPWKAIKTINQNIDSITNGKSRKQVNYEAMFAQTEMNRNNEEIAQLQVIRDLMWNGKEIAKEQIDLILAFSPAWDGTIEALDAIILRKNNMNKGYMRTIGLARELTQQEKDAIKTYNRQEDAYNEINSLAKKLYDASKELVELFVDEDSLVTVFADMGMNMASTVLDTLALQANIDATRVSLQAAQVEAQAFGLAMNYAAGIVGWIVMGIQLLSQVLSAIFNAHDKAKQKEIDKEIEKVEKLEKALEDLEERLESVYSMGQLNSAMHQTQTNIDKQIRSYERMMRLEEQKKKTDKDQIKDWQESIDELREKRLELHKEMVESLGGDYDIRSVARDFVDAWIDAFKETGDGLKGLQENFKEFFLNILLEQAVMDKVGGFIGPVLDYINNVVLKDYLVTEQERNTTEAMMNSALQMSDDYLTMLFGENGVLSKWIDDSESSLSGLQQGIQGVTEETAQIIEAYLNSIRFYIAQDNQNLADLRNFFIGTGEEANPMLSQLRIIAQQTTAIYDLLDSVSRAGHSQGGRGIKVFID